MGLTDAPSDEPFLEYKDRTKRDTDSSPTASGKRGDLLLRLLYALWHTNKYPQCCTVAYLDHSASHANCCIALHSVLICIYIGPMAPYT
jgi:hypothetical protein